MMLLLRTLTVAGALLAVTAAHATTYDFSYKFGNGDVIAGSFDGSANGNRVYFSSNATFSVNGKAVAGPLSGNNTAFSGPAIFSFDGLANDFILSDSAGNALLSGAFTGPVTDVINYWIPPAGYGAGPGVEPYLASNWKLAVAGAVPEPASGAMLLAGLALAGAVARRRTGNVRSRLQPQA